MGKRKCSACLAEVRTHTGKHITEFMSLSVVLSAVSVLGREN